MDLLLWLTWINEHILAVPTTVLFFGTALVLTIKTRFAQVRGFPHFIHMLTSGIKKKDKNIAETEKINAFHALFTAMGTTMGMGNIVGPSVAIFSGGPGALFWLLLYIFFGSVTKFTEVVFALNTRTTTKDGQILGGPMQYLGHVHAGLAQWYGFVMPLVLLSWCSLQSNTFAQLLAQEGVPLWASGTMLALFVALMLWSGAKHIGALASKLVPFMFVMYVSIALFILLKNPLSLHNAVMLVIQSVIQPAAAMGGFLGATIFQAIHTGIYKGIFITESGIGTASIPHAMANTNKPTDQGILAMCSSISDMLLCTLSGLLVLTTGVWIKGVFRSTLIYEAFSANAPLLGKYILLASLSLFIITTVMGNGFNGVQLFNGITRYRYTWVYIVVLSCIISAGSVMSTPLIWGIVETMLALVAIPNLIGILYLAFKNPEKLRM